MECIHCKGPMEKGAAPFTVDRKGYLVHWEAVPAWVCGQCGEAYFESREVDLIQKALAVLDRESAAFMASAQETDSR
ncbi:MAG: YgiT-type zinc finger protein [Deltaproteobacteria bacterium]|nr:YgiT-type zinc finger protein [Deltaproteobacteria bacterium]